MKKLIILFIVAGIHIAFLTTYAQDCTPTSITKVEKEGAGNRITWTLPTIEKETKISQGGDLGNWGSGGVKDYGVYHRFRPEDLTSVSNATLVQVVFAPWYWIPVQTCPGHTYTIQIYKGGKWGATPNDRNPGTLIASQKLNSENLIFHTENTITLETPVPIDASQELWIGYWCTKIDSVQIGTKCSAGMDKDAPFKEGLGNITFFFNEWLTWYEETSTKLNWCIKGIVQTIDGLTVNIYHNDNKIDSDIQGTTYLHNNPTGEEHCYKVEVNCLGGGVSLLSNEMCATVGINDNGQNAKFILYPNPAWNELQITNYELRDGVIEIYDVYGKKISSHHLIASSSHHKIDISSLSSGVYFMRLIEGNHSYMQRFIKQ